MRRWLGCVPFLIAAPLFAQTADDAVSRAQGLAAWDRIYTVTSHPRCTNCHVGPDGRPMWQDLGFGEAAVHGMNVRADQSRIGAESIPCKSCHVTSSAANTRPHAPPHIDDAWRLAPVELEWLGKTSAQVCMQMRDPATNDGHDIAGLVAHLANSAFVAWGFAPGAGRSAPTGTPAKIAADVAEWGAAGSPCAGDG